MLYYLRLFNFCTYFHISKKFIRVLSIISQHALFGGTVVQKLVDYLEGVKQCLTKGHKGALGKTLETFIFHYRAQYYRQKY